jgi:tetratricopeptide (TPR) repeat protein
MGGTEGAKFLEEAVAAYRSALEVRTHKSLPQQWEKTLRNLAYVYDAQKNWPNLAPCLEELAFYSKNEELYEMALSLYRDVLKDSNKADELERKWRQGK